MKVEKQKDMEHLAEVAADAARKAIAAKKATAVLPPEIQEAGRNRMTAALQGKGRRAARSASPHRHQDGQAGAKVQRANRDGEAVLGAGAEAVAAREVAAQEAAREASENTPISDAEVPAGGEASDIDPILSAKPVFR